MGGIRIGVSPGGGVREVKGQTRHEGRRPAAGHKCQALEQSQWQAAISFGLHRGHKTPSL